MTDPKPTQTPSAENEARVRESGINLTTDYGKWVLQLAQTSKIHMCLARRDFDFLCVQPGDGAGRRCALHGGASRGPTTAAGKARARANLLQHRPPKPAPIAVGIAALAQVDATPVTGEFLSTGEVASLTGKKRAAAQCRELQAMGIPFLRRGGAGAPVVSRVLVQQAMSTMGGER